MKATNWLGNSIHRANLISRQMSTGLVKLCEEKKKQTDSSHAAVPLLFVVQYMAGKISRGGYWKTVS